MEEIIILYGREGFKIYHSEFFFKKFLLHLKEIRKNWNVDIVKLHMC